MLEPKNKIVEDFDAQGVAELLDEDADFYDDDDDGIIPTVNRSLDDPSEFTLEPEEELPF